MTSGMTPRDAVKWIIGVVAMETRIPVDVILSPRRTKPVVEARYMAIRAVHRACPHYSTTQLGRIFNRDHTTILYALDRCRDRSPTV